MSATEKYSKLVEYARNNGVSDLSVSEKNNVLTVTGKASATVKDKLWEIYGELDPDMRSGDLVLDITVDNASGNQELYEVKPGDNLSKIASRYPGMTWQKIMEANKDTIKDANLIYPGQKIKIPLASKK